MSPTGEATATRRSLVYLFHLRFFLPPQPVKKAKTRRKKEQDAFHNDTKKGKNPPPPLPPSIPLFPIIQKRYPRSRCTPFVHLLITLCPLPSVRVVHKGELGCYCSMSKKKITNIEVAFGRARDRMRRRRRRMDFHRRFFLPSPFLHSRLKRKRRNPKHKNETPRKMVLPAAIHPGRPTPATPYHQRADP